jgi:hypothetical protein
LRPPPPPEPISSLLLPPPPPPPPPWPALLPLSDSEPGGWSWALLSAAAPAHARCH